MMTEDELPAFKLKLGALSDDAFQLTREELKSESGFKFSFLEKLYKEARKAHVASLGGGNGDGNAPQADNTPEPSEEELAKIAADLLTSEDPLKLVEAEHYSALVKLN